MAKYNEILAGRLNNALKKFLSMKGPAPAPQVSGEFIPTFSFLFGVETRFLEEWGRFGSSLAIPAVAAQTGASRIRNPAGSNVIAVIEKLTYSTTLADRPLLQIAATGADLGTIGATFRLDPRGRPLSGMVISSSGTGVSLTTGIEVVNLGANATYDFILFEDQELTLLPGDAIQVLANTVNQAFNTSMIWRERLLEESERM